MSEVVTNAYWIEVSDYGVSAWRTLYGRKPTHVTTLKAARARKVEWEADSSQHAYRIQWKQARITQMVVEDDHVEIERVTS
jgi:hypothetical protein